MNRDFTAALTHYVSQLRFCFLNQGDDLLRSLGGNQTLAQFRISEETADAGEQGKVLSNGRGDQQKEEFGGFAVEGAVTDSLVVTAEDHERFLDQADQRVAGVGQGDAVADTGAVELFAFLQSAEKDLPGLGPVRNFRNAG